MKHQTGLLSYKRGWAWQVEYFINFVNFLLMTLATGDKGIET
jgi:hypothetical protein